MYLLQTLLAKLWSYRVIAPMVLWSLGSLAFFAACCAFEVKGSPELYFGNASIWLIWIDTLNWIWTCNAIASFVIALCIQSFILLPIIVLQLVIAWSNVICALVIRPNKLCLIEHFKRLFRSRWSWSSCQWAFIPILIKIPNFWLLTDFVLQWLFPSMLLCIFLAFLMEIFVLLFIIWVAWAASWPSWIFLSFLRMLPLILELRLRPLGSIYILILFIILYFYQWSIIEIIVILSWSPCFLFLMVVFMMLIVSLSEYLIHLSFAE